MMTFEDILDGLTQTDQKIIHETMVLHEDISRQTAAFAAQTGLACKNGCGACCTNPHIEATVTEVLPLAVHLWSQGLAESKLEAIQRHDFKGVCVFYQPDAHDKASGRCGIYRYRPGLCRLFGFSARRDKLGELELMTCRIIKDSQPEACQQTQEGLNKGVKAPLLSTYAFGVANIDPVHGQQFLPINQAIAKALEKVGYGLEEKLKQKLPTPLE
jgi:Fe-S-cluster containining protein